MMLRRLISFFENNNGTGRSTRLRLGVWPMTVMVICFSVVISETVASAQMKVDTLGDTHMSNADGTDAAGHISLRSAVEYANAHSGTTITVPAGTYNLSLGELRVGPSGSVTVTINGAGASTTIIKQTDGTNRVFNLDSSVAGGVTCTIDSVTIEDGQDKADGLGGGGIIAGSGNSTPSDRLTLTNCTIQNNSAYGDASVQEPTGGGIEMDGGYLTITNCTISSNTLVTNTYSNTAVATGAGVEYGPFSASETLTISGCTFSGNSINVGNAEGQGAGLYMDNTVSSTGISVTKTVFSGNTFTSTGTNSAAGGAIYLSGGSNSISYCRFSGNTAPTDANIHLAGGTTNAANNWWGSNSGASGVTAGATVTPFLNLTSTASPTIIDTGATSTITASFLTNSANSAISASNLGALSGLAVTWGGFVHGTPSNEQTSITSGIATATFKGTGTSKGIGSAQATVDNGTTTSPTITVLVFPGVATGSATSITQTGATLNGTVNANDTTTTASFDYGTTISYGTNVAATPSTVTGSTNTSVSVALTGLSAGTLYHFRVKGASGAGTTNGVDSTFTTVPSAPTATSASSVSATSFSANWNAATGATGYFLDVSTSNTFSTFVSGYNNLNVSNVTTYSVTGLTTNTTYYYRVRASNSSGTSGNSNTISQVTSSTAPTVSTDSVSAITTTTATLYGTVNANNASTTVTIEYGLTISYGNSVTAAQSPVTGTTNTMVSGAVTALTAGTTYHYRIVGNNTGGTTNGGDLTFNTKDQSLAVQVSSFKAAASFSSVTLTWQTQSEVDNAGFNILREDPGIGIFKLLSSYTSNGILKGLGTSSTGQTYNFTDDRVVSGLTYQYKIQSVSTSGTTKDLSTLSVTVDIPKAYALYQNYPNPFNPSTTIRFDLKEQSNVMLDIYNVLGQRVLEENYGSMNAGRFNENVNMDRFASGLYYYRIVAAGIDGQKFVSIKKALLLK